jgi:hypothetical protein
MIAKSDNVTRGGDDVASIRIAKTKMHLPK